MDLLAAVAVIVAAVVVAVAIVAAIMLDPLKAVVASAVSPINVSVQDSATNTTVTQSSTTKHSSEWLNSESPEPGSYSTLIYTVSTENICNETSLSGCMLGLFRRTGLTRTGGLAWVARRTRIVEGMAKAAEDLMEDVKGIAWVVDDLVWAVEDILAEWVEDLIWAVGDILVGWAVEDTTVE